MGTGQGVPPKSAIAKSDVDSITVRGKDLCSELVGVLDFTSYFYFLLAGEVPTERQRRVIDATLIAIAEHGITPSAVATRMTFAADPETMQGAVAAGILGCGTVVLGSAHRCGVFLNDLVNQKGAGNDEIILERLRSMKARGEAVPGYGHPIHVNGDPRTTRLLEVIEGLGASGPHVAMLRRVETLLPEGYGRPLPINVSGAIPAVLLDVGFPLAAIKGVPLLARTAGLIAHVYEEMRRPIGFPLYYAAADAVLYDGPEPKPEIAKT